MSTGSTFILREFPVKNPLKEMDKQHLGSIDFRRAFAEYYLQLEYLEAIWVRLKEDFRAMGDFYSLQQELSKFSVGHVFTADQNARYGLGVRTELLLSLDWDSFIIHASILMDRLGQLAVTLLHQKIPSRSFSDQKKFFRRHENNPYHPNEQYASLVRERTDWYNIKLKPARDNMVVHAFQSSGGMMMSPTHKRIRVLRMRYVSEFDMEKIRAQLLGLKQKYEHSVPELKSTTGFWEIVDFFMTHDLRPDARDVETISQIIGTVGGYLPDVDALAEEIFNFLKEFRDAFKA